MNPEAFSTVLVYAITLAAMIKLLSFIIEIISKVLKQRVKKKRVYQGTEMLLGFEKDSMEIIKGMVNNPFIYAKSGYCECGCGHHTMQNPSAITMKKHLKNVQAKAKASKY